MVTVCFTIKQKNMFKKNTALFYGLVAILLIHFSSCTKTVTIVENPGGDITTQMSFSKDIIPIFEAKCNASACHGSGGKAPNLTAPQVYNALNGGSYLKPNDPDNSLLMMWLNGKKSPVMPIGSGTDQEINAKIYAWIKQGALNN